MFSFLLQACNYDSPYLHLVDPAKGVTTQQLDPRGDIGPVTLGTSQYSVVSERPVLFFMSRLSVDPVRFTIKPLKVDVAMSDSLRMA